MSAIHEQEHEQNSFLPALHNNDHPRSNSEDYGLFDEVVQHENRTAEIKTHPSETQHASVVVGEQNNVKEEEEEENVVTSATSNRRMNDDMSSLESESFCEVCSSDERSNNDGVLPVRHYKMESRFDCNICLESVEEPVVTRCGHLYCWSCLYKWLEPGILPNESPFYYHSSSSSGGLIGRTSTTDEDTFVSPALVMGDDDQGADASQQTSQYAATTQQQQHQVPSSSRNNILPTTGTRQAIEIDHTRRCCPVCKAECTVPSLVPIYVREEPSTVVHGNNMKSKKRTNNTNTLRKRIIRKDIINAEDSQQAPANNTPTTSSNSPHRDTSSRGRSSSIPSRPHPSNIIRFNRPTMNATNTSPSYAFHHQDTTSISRGAGAGGIRSSFDMSLMPVLLGLHPPPRHHQGMMGNPHGGDDYNIMRSFSDVTPGTTGYTTTLSDEEWLREDAATSFLSRLLLMLFTFVILVLLFF